MMRNDETPESSPSIAEPTDRPGRRLAEVRTRLGRSQADVAAALKLPRSIIEAIEDDRMDRIAPIYRRGYLINYARELGEAPERYLGADVAAPPPLKGVLPTAGPSRVDRYLRYATYFLGTTLIVPPLVYFFVAGGSRLFDETPEAVVSGGTDGAAEVRPVDPSTVSGRIARALALGETPGEADDGPLAASTLPLPALRPAESTPIEEPTAEAPQAQPSGLHRVDLELVDDSWVEITDADGQRLEFDLLRAGSERTYEGRPPFRLLFGRANAVRVELDGRAIRFDGDDAGSVAEFALEPTSAAGEGDESTVADRDTP
jgi:cytoskeleton protein RodZ